MSIKSNEREQLEKKVDFALRDLSDYFKRREDPLQFEVNRLWRQYDHIKTIPNFPEVHQTQKEQDEKTK